MNIQHFEFHNVKNLHVETDHFLLLGYDSEEDASKAKWKPSKEEWRLQNRIDKKDGKVFLFYEKNDNNCL